MKKIAFFDTKPYDKIFFKKLKDEYDLEFRFYESKLNIDNAYKAKGYDGAVAFVNDDIDKETIDALCENGIRVLAMRCAGYNNVDIKAAFNKIHVLRVPAYSPYAVAEHAMALLLCINRKIHKAYNRTRDNNFSISGLTGFDLHGKTVGVIGTGKIGQVFIDICRGFGMKILAYDPYPIKDSDITYTDVETLCKESDVISLHCPLTKETNHLINEKTIKLMKEDAVIINTSRGALIDSEALTTALVEERIGGAGLDVYEEESDLFFEDASDKILKDNVLARLVNLPNVVVTSHQAFLTKEALENIARTTCQNLYDYFEGNTLENEICYKCKKFDTCDRKGGKCF
ncbi:MAG: 2-hydroxyacid dehydrogenase [Clostridia bacterium]|nr:2-hydroxyacid dehydrogenase [Clostridia bacterium]